MTEVPPWNPTPLKYLYVQLADHITARIEAGELEPGRRLPPEREIAADYGVAFHTVRNATKVLRDRGLIITMHGRGTFVADRHA